MSIIYVELNESKEPTTINNKEHNIINKIIAIMITNVLIPEGVIINVTKYKSEKLKNNQIKYISSFLVNDLKKFLVFVMLLI